MIATPYVCMPGQAFTGSTLLAFLLNAHPDISSAGALTGPTPRVAQGSYNCSCGLHLSKCPFWVYVERSARNRGIPFEMGRAPWPTKHRVASNRPINAALIRSLRSTVVNNARDQIVWRAPWIRQRLDQANDASRHIATTTLKATGTTFFVDSSRDPLRPLYLDRDESLDVHCLHLVRDVRSNVASIMKHHGTTVETAARRWRRQNIEADRIRSRLSTDRWLRLTYSELCHDLPATYSRVLAFIGAEDKPPPADFRAGGHHILGNEMRLGASGEVHEDNRWREVLSTPALEQIARIAGRQNRAFGFDWP